MGLYMQKESIATVLANGGLKSLGGGEGGGH